MFKVSTINGWHYPLEAMNHPTQYLDGKSDLYLHDLNGNIVASFHTDMVRRSALTEDEAQHNARVAIQTVNELNRVPNIHIGKEKVVNEWAVDMEEIEQCRYDREMEGLTV